MICSGRWGGEASPGFLGPRPSESPPGRRLPSVAPSARSRGGGLKDCDPADGAPAACIVAWRGGSAPRGTRWERCQAPFRDEKRARHRARVPSTRREPGRASWARCRTRHAPVSVRRLRARILTLIAAPVCCRCRWLRSIDGKGDDLVDAIAAGGEHDQPIDAEGDPGARRHAVLEGCEEILVQRNIG